MALCFQVCNCNNTISSLGTIAQYNTLTDRLIEENSIILLSSHDMVEVNYSIFGKVGTMLNLSELNQEFISKELIHDILFKNISDDGKPCDCIFVPARRTGNKYRTPAAV
jgi:hypothetical protein